MVYSRQYNTRNSTTGSGSGGRYNTSGQFVAAGGHQQQSPQQQQFTAPPPAPPPMPPRNVQPVNIQLTNSQPQQFQNKIQDTDIDMKAEPDTESVVSEDAGPARPAWMKSKLPGVKKISKKEKRRRQNEHLRRLITPKNALMVLNEMMLQDQLTNFKVEAADTPNQYYKNPKTSFCADLTLDGISYKGYGENKLTARNAAAEQAIRDLIIKRMQKAVSQDLAADELLAGAGVGVGEGEEDPLPMIQLASFALHKLFSEWEYEGHKVPQLRHPAGASMSEGEDTSAAGTGAGAGAGGGARARPKAPKPKEVPANAPAMHPCMLLTYMRPHLEYRELAVDGDRPQRMTFTMGVDVDGATYIGKASNKKEARKAAARAACTALFGVHFEETPTATAPAPAAAT